MQKQYNFFFKVAQLWACLEKGGGFKEEQMIKISFGHFFTYSLNKHVLVE